MTRQNGYRPTTSGNVKLCVFRALYSSDDDGPSAPTKCSFDDDGALSLDPLANVASSLCPPAFFTVFAVASVSPDGATVSDVGEVGGTVVVSGFGIGSIARAEVLVLDFGAVVVSSPSPFLLRFT